MIVFWKTQKEAGLIHLDFLENNRFMIILKGAENQRKGIKINPVCVKLFIILTKMLVFFDKLMGRTTPFLRKKWVVNKKWHVKSLLSGLIVDGFTYQNWSFKTYTVGFFGDGIRIIINWMYSWWALWKKWSENLM